MLKFKSTAILFSIVLIGFIFADWRFGIPVWSYWTVVGVFISIILVGVFHLPMEFFTPVNYKGLGDHKMLSITFDDGPIPEKTEKVLNILKKHEVTATFFLIGNRMEANPDIVQRIVKEGHLIGNHSYTHDVTFDFKSTSAMIDEMKKTDALLRLHTGRTPRFFRPPYGVTNPGLARAIKAQGYLTIGWSVRSLDTVLQKEKILKRIKNVKAGDIVLFHDSSDATLSLLDSFLYHVKSIGLKIVGVDRLLNEEAYESQEHK